MTKILYMVVPCYNEELVLDETSERLKAKYEQLISNNIISPKSRVVYVNDGSKDKTWEKIQEKHNENPMFSGINLSRNRGHQNALLAGLMTVRNLADCVISMDADLQDDINAIDEMLEKFENENCDIVYGVRDNRDTDTVFKRRTAGAFYKLMQGLGSQSVPNHADFRLMSRRALDGLAQFPEQNLFLRGMVPLAVSYTHLDNQHWVQSYNRYFTYNFSQFDIEYHRANQDFVSFSWYFFENTYNLVISDKNDNIYRAYEFNLSLIHI